MNSLVIVVADEVIQDLLGFHAILHLMFFTEIVKPSLKVIKDLFHLPLGLCLSLSGIDHPDAEAAQGPPKLDLPFILTDLVSHMDSLMKNKPKDRMVIQVVGQRDSVSGDRLPHGLKMLKGRLYLNQPRSDDSPRIAATWCQTWCQA